MAKAPFLVELGIHVFQINGFRLVELVIEGVRMGEVAFNKYWVIGLQAPGLSRKQRLVFHFLSDFWSALFCWAAN